EALPLNGRFAGSPKIDEAWNQYRRALTLIDGELGRVRADLETRGLSDRTLLIVWSDHGYEFDDSGGGYIGHASAYSPAQLRATLMMDWPERPAAHYTHRTSHHDLPVTLLEDVLGCDNLPSDYSMGRNLYAGRSWDWIIAGSYTSHAIVQPERIVVSHPGGFV